MYEKEQIQRIEDIFSTWEGTPDNLPTEDKVAWLLGEFKWTRDKLVEYFGKTEEWRAEMIVLEEENTELKTFAEKVRKNLKNLEKGKYFPSLGVE